VIIRKSAQEIEGMARAGELLYETLQLVAGHLEPGVSMLELDRIADDYIASRGGHPTSKGYKGFPAALCISPNSMVVHGIPDGYRAREGDLISVDLGVTLDGLVADSAVTLPVGDISAQAQRLLDVCQEALAAGIEQARPGNRLSDISHAVQTVVEGAGYSVVRSLVGHGVGRSYHEDPQIPNYGPPGRGPLLQEGMTLAIEPMITAGRPEVYVHDDDWSISSVDDSLAAHFEHTVAVTADGPRILTRGLEASAAKPPTAGRRSSGSPAATPGAGAALLR
jgi:methionyl aminopeptidase